MPIFGELPEFETNTYTFLSTYLPWAERRRHGAPQQHVADAARVRSAARSSGRAFSARSRTSSSTPGTWSASALGGLEPFDFENADMSDDLWLGEGFTSYFDSLILHRAGLLPLDGLLGELAGIDQRRDARARAASSAARST